MIFGTLVWLIFWLFKSVLPNYYLIPSSDRVGPYLRKYLLGVFWDTLYLLIKVLRQNIQYRLCNCSEHIITAVDFFVVWYLLIMGLGQPVNPKQFFVSTPIKLNQKQCCSIATHYWQEFESRCGQIYMHITNHFSDKQKQSVIRFCLSNLLMII